MTNKELQRLSRRDLLELLVQQERQNEILQKRVSELEQALDKQSIEISKAGTLAEATIGLNNVFESADKAAAQYLENIKRLSEQQEGMYDKIISAAEKNARAILEEAERERQRRIKEADDYWQRMNDKLKKAYQEKNGLSTLSPTILPKKN